jgi:cobalt ABC transporter, permease protein CbiQ
LHVHYQDPYRPGRSLIHALDARVKLLVTIAFILTVALIPPGFWPVYILLLSLIISVEILSEIGVVYVLRRSILVLPFMLAALPIIFTLQGAPLFTLSLGGWTLTATQTGMERFISIVLKSWTSVQAAIVLTTTTPFPDLLLAMRSVKIPRMLVTIFGMMWRYLFVLGDETLRMMRARASRSGQSDTPSLKAGGSIIWRAHVTGGMAGSLFIRAFERSDRIYMAMVARGYDGDVRAYAHPETSLVNWLVLVFSLLLFTALLALAYLL